MTRGNLTTRGEVRDMASTPIGLKNLFSFFQLCGKLKHLKRTGWVKYTVQDPETVSGHMYRMAMMAFLFGGSGDNSVNKERCIKMALVHDLAESIVGDIIPHCGVSKDEKHKREREAMVHIRTLLPEEVGKELVELWEEYEAGASSEALMVRDLDKFDMIFQAFEYETAENRPGELQEFFDSTRGKFKHPEVSKWVAELESLRNNPT